MKTKHLLTAFVLGVASMAGGNASANDVKNGTFTNNLNGWGSAIAGRGTLDGSSSAQLNNFLGAPGSIWQIVSVAVASSYTFSFDYNAAQPLFVSLTKLSDVNTWNLGKTGASTSHFSESLNLTAGSYLLSFTGRNARIDNVSLEKAVSVPGPEAGAGLGALAMGAIALYLKRRRKEDAAA